MDNQEQRLARLRKLYAFARSKGNTRWMEQIANDAKKIKNESQLENVVSEAKEIFTLPIDIP